MEEGDHDRAILRWPFLCALCAFLLPIGAFGTMGGFTILFFFPFIPLAIVLTGAWVTIQTVIEAVGAARRKAWRRFTSVSILPVCVVSGLWNFAALWEIWKSGGDWLYFELRKSTYVAAVEKAPAKGSRFLVFPGGGWAGVARRVYVYDETDQILLPEAERTVEFQRRFDATELQCDALAFRLEGHFYKAFISC